MKIKSNATDLYHVIGRPHKYKQINSSFFHFLMDAMETKKNMLSSFYCRHVERFGEHQIEVSRFSVYLAGNV